MSLISMEEEVRCGYTVSDKQKKIWNIELELAVELLRVCEKHDIQIFAWSGTMLGAVRHKGFIPWDDDLDFAMTRDNFEKLLRVADEFCYPFFLQHALNDRQFFLDYARLRNSETTGLITWNKSANYNNGIYIDIYVLDGAVESEYKLKKQLFWRKIYRQFIYAFYKKNISWNWRGARKIFLSLLHPFSRLRKYEDWVEKYNNLLKRYTPSSDRLALITHEQEVIHKYWTKKDELKDIICVEFETIKLPIIADYDHILTRCYGNYMEYPPVEERGVWHEGQIIFEPDVPYTEYLKR